MTTWLGFVASFVVCLSSSTVATQTTPPPLTQPVNDFAHVIDDQSRAELDRRIRALQQATGDVLIVATVPTYEPYADINEYAVKMFENGGRGIGQKGTDNGLLIVVAVNDRKVRIEVGYDLEQYIPDGFAGETIRQAITPAFKQGQYGPGLVAGATRLINRIAEQRNVTIPDVPQQPSANQAAPPHIPIALIFFLIWLAIVLLRSNRRRRRWFWFGGPWSGWSGGVGGFGGGGFSGGGFGGFSGGSGGGGFGGFGGGGSGGGGASGSW